MCDNPKLVELEEQGFKHSEECGKTMDVTMYELVSLLNTQWRQLFNTYIVFANENPSNIKELMQEIANLRNIAGCLLLEIIEEYIDDTKQF